MKGDGIDDTLRALDKAYEEAKARAMAGLFESGLKVMELSMREAPVHHGNLRASAYVRSASKTDTVGGAIGLDGRPPSTSLDDDEIEVGFYAEYAGPVHDMTDAVGGNPRPDGLGETWDTGNPLFLLGPLERNRDKIAEIIQHHIDAGGTTEV